MTARKAYTWVVTERVLLLVTIWLVIAVIPSIPIWVAGAISPAFWADPKNVQAFSQLWVVVYIALGLSVVVVPIHVMWPDLYGRKEQRLDWRAFSEAVAPLTFAQWIRPSVMWPILRRVRPPR